MKKTLAAAAVAALALSGAAAAQSITPLEPTKSTQNVLTIGGLAVPVPVAAAIGILAVGGIIVVTTNTSGT